MGILRLIAVGAFGMVILLIITSNAQGWRTETQMSSPGLAAVAQALPPQDFLATGALTFYKRNGMLGPWLLYETQDSVVMTKALVFTGGSVCDAVVVGGFCGTDALSLASAYGGVQVRIVGSEMGEHVVVERMFPASVSDERIALVQADLEKSATAFGVTIVPRSLAGDADAALVRAEVIHDGAQEEIVFEQGTLVKVGQRQVTLTHVQGGTLYFAVALEK